MQAPHLQTQDARAWWQAALDGRISARQLREYYDMAPQTNIEQLQKDIMTTMRAQSREAAVRALLTHLGPHDDDWQQAYPEILRRAQNALATECHQVRETEKSDG